MCVGKNVLIIDDNEDNLFLLRLILEILGCDVRSASNGEEGIAKVYRAVPDLIILDLMMPDISGIEVIERLKANRQLPYIPIMLLTANAELFRGEAIALCDELFYKPFDVEHLLSTIKLLLSPKQIF